MNTDLHKLVLALDLHPSSFGFAMFEGPSQLLDWGIKSFWQGANPVKVPMPAKLARLLDQYEPEIVVARVPKTAVVWKRVRMATELARNRRVKWWIISDAAIRKSFPLNSRNKYEIATAIAERFPELSPRLGMRRKVWQAERYSMCIFDAVAVGIAHFGLATNRGATCDRTFPPLPH